MICKYCDYQILNGRAKGDSLGKRTFHNKNGISTIDYATCDANIIDSIKYFIVKPPNYLSDHSQIITWIDIKEITIETSTTSNTNFSNVAYSITNISGRIHLMGHFPNSLDRQTSKIN